MPDIFVRGEQTMRRGDAAIRGSLFRQFVITSNKFNLTQGTFQVFGLEGASGGIRDGKFAPSDAEPTLLFDKDFNGLDSAAKQFDQLITEARQRGFELIKMVDILEFEDKARHSQQSRPDEMFWKRGWDSNPSSPLRTCNLLILHHARKARNTQNANRRYTAGTRKRVEARGETVLALPSLMDEFNPPIPVIPKLSGEAPPHAYDMRTGEGNLVNPGHAIFPIVRYDTAGKVYLLGTGFFITTNGLFVTARHVLMDTFDENHRQKYPIGIIQFLGDNVYIQRPILRCGYNSVADVAVGVAAPMQSNADGQPVTNPIFTLTLLRPGLNVQVVTYAYPKHANLISSDGIQQINFMPTYYDGFITDYFPFGRDKVLLPGPCYQTSMILHAGASGGPVFAPNGLVFGVNSTGFDGTDISFISRIHEIFALSIDDVAVDGSASRKVSIIELAKAGHIVVRPQLENITRHLGLFEK